MSNSDHPYYYQPLPRALYRAQQTRELDRLAIEDFAIPGFTLMKRAGRAAFQLLMDRWPNVEAITVIAGKGNNGGDGFVIATLAAQKSLPVKVLLLGDAAEIRGDALLAYQAAVAAGVAVEAFHPGAIGDSGVIVDALLGTGLSGAVRAAHAEVIDAINASALPVLAVDIPSGLCSDTGVVLGVAVQAEATISFIGLKQGLFTGAAKQLCGRIAFAGLGVPADVYAQLTPSAYRLPSLEQHAQLAMPTRRADAHKGAYGHVLVVGGDYGMAGAALMAAEAAARCGAGLISVATRPEHVAAFVGRCPELMVHGVSSGQELEPLLARATVIVIGPGLGRGPWGEQLLDQVWRSEQPLVVDADALNLLSEGRIINPAQRRDWIISPHPGEAARLLKSDPASINRDRFASVHALQKQTGAAVILKGAGSLVDAGAGIFLCDAGNPGMASGGMGDVLSGVLGALLAQGLNIQSAANYAVCLHAWAADLAAEDGQRGLLATDLLPQLRRLVDGSAPVEAAK